MKQLEKKCKHKWDRQDFYTKRIKEPSDNLMGHSYVTEIHYPQCEKCSKYKTPYGIIKDK